MPSKTSLIQSDCGAEMLCTDAASWAHKEQFMLTYVLQKLQHGFLGTGSLLRSTESSSYIQVERPNQSS